MRTVELRLAGTGGQGLILAARLLADALLRDGRWVAHSQSYEPTSRGGPSRADLVIADGPVDYPLATSLDALILLDRIALLDAPILLRPGAVVIADAERAADVRLTDATMLLLPLCATARGLGNERVANIVALGALDGRLSLCGHATLEATIRVGVPRRFLNPNLEALAAGYRLAEEGASGRSGALALSTSG